MQSPFFLKGAHQNPALFQNTSHNKGNSEAEPKRKARNAFLTGRLQTAKQPNQKR
jgi:hypothetical protein